MNNCCNRIIKSSGYSTDASNFIILTTGETFNLANRKAFYLILCQNIPIQSSNLPVLIQVNGTNYPLLDKFGNNVLVSDINTRTRYSLVFGSNPVHFLAFNIISCLNNVDLTTTAPTTTTGA